MALEIEKRWENELLNRSRAVALVRGRLGCSCPEEIFDHYQVRQQVVRSMPVMEMVMGDRLLVWMMDGHKVSDPRRTLAQILKAGLEERDRRGLNRFRLVVVGDFPSWENQWGHLTDALDPKVHLHVLPETCSPSPKPERNFN